ncbi:glycosyltransferase involved in cell wall biosynthesis [Streptosporangium album]|uniref:Glycosyltransferase involved in cell wall biosynthesis n=1 Tax=Streptosporangium album TaxID=47479 RepID=A0A7W7RYK7_9ACTN|nr:glycosyltransferase family 4 protein [Streptosporangium album]MBB4940638.1 glycosyltransferase involved in cell wall biosynthesis [Streptosporangium album]
MKAPILTALDLPAASPGGSVELLYDLYTGAAPLIDAQVFMLNPEAPHTGVPAGVHLLAVGGKCLDGPLFWTYVEKLRYALAARIDPCDVGVVHLQHLAFGATAALIRLLPRHPHLALVHGTDLLLAAAHPTQRRVLHQATKAARAIVVPTAAMAAELHRLAPDARCARLVHIPWGIPDQLLRTPPRPRPRREGPLRLLYAGRLTPRKGVDVVAATLTAMPGLHLSIAAPPGEYAACAARLAWAGCRPAYLGWLPRTELWQAFADHDVLIVPSVTLEAFGLVALEAQACGLPVVYRLVPGLTEVLAESALGVDLADLGALAQILIQLQTDPAMLTDLRAAGLRNAARFPLSATAAALNALSEQIV